MGIFDVVGDIPVVGGVAKEVGGAVGGVVKEVVGDVRDVARAPGNIAKQAGKAGEGLTNLIDILPMLLIGGLVVAAIGLVKNPGAVTAGLKVAAKQ